MSHEIRTERVPNTPANTNVPHTGRLRFSDFYGTEGNIAPGTEVFSMPGNLTTGTTVGEYADVTIISTTFGYQVSGAISDVTMKIGGNIRCTIEIDPTNHTGRANNSGDDRAISVYQITGSGASFVVNGRSSHVALNTLYYDVTINNVIPGDVFRFYMNNSMDWRNNLGYEQAKNFYIVGA